MYTHKLWKPVDLDATPNQYGLIKSGFTTITKAADSGIAGPLIRQDLDPVIYKTFVRRFPFWEMLQKVEANGLVHAFNTKDSPATAASQAELGTVSDSNSSYTRHTANIAELAVRVGVSLKAQFAVRQGGANYDPVAEELEGGMDGLAKLAQNAICRLQATDATSTTANSMNGKYDANMFNGLRYILANSSPSGNTAQVDITGTNDSGKTLITNAIRTVADAIIDAGGEPSLLVAASNVVTLVENEQMQFFRFVNAEEVIPGVKCPQVVAGGSVIPMLRVPGNDAMANYTDGTHTYQDIYVLDMSVLKWAYLGGAAPTVLEIPVASDGKLQRLFVPYMMGGLVCAAPSFIGRVQIKLS